MIEDESVVLDCGSPLYQGLLHGRNLKLCPLYFGGFLCFLFLFFKS